MGSARFGVTLGVVMAAVVGCSDDDSPPIVEIDAAVSSSAPTDGPVDTTGAGGGETSTTTATSDDSEPGDTLTIDVPTSSDVQSTSAPTGGPSDTSSAPTGGDVSTSEMPTDGTIIDTSVPPGTSDVDTNTTPAETSDDIGAIAPPGNMTVITNFDAAAGFQDGQHNLAANHVRTYADSLMTVEAAFTGTGQQTGVNFNYAGDLCGYDVLARIRLRSGTIATGGVQMRVWSDSWSQFASQSAAIGAVGEWLEYRITWSDVVSENSSLDINAINAVGFAFMTFGTADTSVFDVDWVGLVPSDTPCPSVDTGVDTDTTTTPDVDSGVIDTTGPDGGTMEELPNLVANGGFEVDTSGWGTWGSGVTLTASTTKARTGAQSMLVAGGTTTGPAATTINNPEPGGTYEVSLWASSAVGAADVRIVGNLACLDNPYPWIVGNTEVASDGWTELTGTLVVPEDCDSPSFQIYLEGDDSGLDVYVDDVSVTLISGGEDTGSTVGDVDSGVLETTGAADTSEAVITTDSDAGVVETTTPPDESDASVGDTSAAVDVDASVSEELTSAPVDTTVAMETSAPADTTVVDATSAPDPYGPNLHTNPGFESSDDYWYQAGDGARARSTDFAHSGTYSLLSSGRTATWNGAGTNLLANGFVTTPVVMGETYLIEAWVRLDGLASATVALSGTFECDGTETTPWLANATANDTGWTLVSGQFTVPTCGGTGLTVASLIVNNAGTAASIYLDDFSVRQVLN